MNEEARNAMRTQMMSQLRHQLVYANDEKFMEGLNETGRNLLFTSISERVESLTGHNELEGLGYGHNAAQLLEAFGFTTAGLIRGTR